MKRNSTHKRKKSQDEYIDLDFKDTAVRPSRKKAYRKPVDSVLENLLNTDLTFFEMTNDYFRFIEEITEYYKKIQRRSDENLSKIVEKVEKAIHFYADNRELLYRRHGASKFVYFANNLKVYSSSLVCAVACADIILALKDNFKNFESQGYDAPKLLSMLAAACSKWPDNQDCQTAIEAIAQHVLTDNKILSCTSMQLSIIALSCSKWTNNKNCRAVVEFIAENLLSQDLNTFEMKDLSGLIKACSRFPISHSCQKSMQIIFSFMIDYKVERLDLRCLEDLANVCSKFPENKGYSTLIQQIAAQITLDILDSVDGRTITNLANAFSKFCEYRSCSMAMQNIAKVAVNFNWNSFNASILTIMANACCKWGYDDNCKTVVEKLGLLAIKIPLNQLSSQELGNLVDACGKWWNSSDKCKAVIQSIAKRLFELKLTDLDNQALAILANVFSRLSTDLDCQSAIVQISQQILPRKISNFQLNHVLLLVDAFGQNKKYENLFQLLATDLAGRDLARENEYSLGILINFFTHSPRNVVMKELEKNVIKYFTKRDLAKLSNAVLAKLAFVLSKCQDMPNCTTVIVKIASFISQKNISDLNFQDLSRLAKAFSKCSDEKECKESAEKIFKQAYEQNYTDFSVHLQDMANAASKWVDSTDSENIVKKISEYLVEKNITVFSPCNIANFANACSKWPKSKRCDTAIRHFGKIISNQDLSGFKPKELASLANAFCKFLDSKKCRTAIPHIAEEIISRRKKLSSFNTQDFDLLSNAFSKFPDVASCEKATHYLARKIIKKDLTKIKSRHIATLASSFSKWPKEDSKKALLKIAEHISEEKNISAFNSLHISSLLNAFSKCLDSLECKVAVLHIAKNITKKHLSRFSVIQISNSASALSKWSETEECRDAILMIAESITKLDQLVDFDHIRLSMLASAIVKYYENKTCRSLILLIAESISVKKIITNYDLKGFIILAKIFSKYPDSHRCKSLIKQIAQSVIKEDYSKFTFHDFANLNLAFSKWPEDASCINAIESFTPYLFKKNYFSHLNSASECHSLGQLSSSYGIFKEYNGDTAFGILCTNSLSSINQFLQQTNPDFQNFELLGLILLFRGFQRAMFLEGIYNLTPGFLEKLIQFTGQPEVMAEATFEDFGTLCHSLRPILKRAYLSIYRARTIELLLILKPIIDSKIREEKLSSRWPAMSFYLVFKAYTVVFTENMRKGKEMSESLTNWLKKLYLQVRQSADNNKFLDNTQPLIEEVELDDPVEFLDFLVEKDTEKLSQSQGSAIFDIQKVFNDLSRHDPQPLSGETGLQPIFKCDISGKNIESQPPRYSILTHLTGGAIQPIWVKLPRYNDPQQLRNTFSFRGLQYRFDIFGGSRMKSEKPDFKQMCRGKNSFSQVNQGQLLGIPLGDTLNGSDFENLIRQLFPYKESFYYVQRALLSAPPELSRLQAPLAPHDHVLAGLFNMAILPDQPPGKSHDFQIKDLQNNAIEVCPHDGTGFIRLSLIKKMGWYHKLDPAGLPPPFHGDQPSAYLPPDALQHYPADSEVAEEFIAHLRQNTRFVEDRIHVKNSEALYRNLTTAGVKGYMAVAVPSQDERIHLPGSKARKSGNLLVGRAPYDKPNLRPIAQKRVATTDQKDPTAQFLNTCWGVQYSFVAQKRSSSDHQESKSQPLFFAKGLLIVLDDALWPKKFNSQQMVLSAEDPKTDSTWMLEKNRVTTNTLLQASGILTLTNIYAPGSLAAIPKTEQKQLDGDYDGDLNLLLFNHDKLFAHIKKYESNILSHPSLKPVKTHTPAITFSLNDRYQFSRVSQIQATRSKVLENFVVLQRTFLAQPIREQKTLSEMIHFEMYEGVEEETRQALMDLLEESQPKNDKIKSLRKCMLASAESMTTHPVTQYLLKDIVGDLEDLRDSKTVKTGSLTEFQQISDDILLKQFRPRWLIQRSSLYNQPRKRLEIAVRQLPVRILEKPSMEHLSNQFECKVQIIKNLLSFGIKVGTDAYKSNTDTNLFLRVAEMIQIILQKAGIALGVYYSKRVARELESGKFNADSVQQNLVDNPTLAAQVMYYSIEEARKGQWRLPGQSSALSPNKKLPSNEKRQESPLPQTDLFKKTASRKSTTASRSEALMFLTQLGR
jgi:hypothetical protein